VGVKYLWNVSGMFGGRGKVPSPCAIYSSSRGGPASYGTQILRQFQNYCDLHVMTSRRMKAANDKAALIAAPRGARENDASAPSELDRFLLYPRLTLWAAFLRRFAAIKRGRCCTAILRIEHGGGNSPKCSSIKRFHLAQRLTFAYAQIQCAHPMIESAQVTPLVSARESRQ